MSDEIKQGFAQGVAYAAAELMRSHGQSGMAYELLVATGLTSTRDLKAAKVDEYDAKVCRRIIKSEGHC